MNFVLAYLLACATYARAQARGALNDCWSAAPKATRVVDTGWYSKLRHPIYVFSTIELTLMVALQWPRWFWIVPVVLGPIQFIRARQEEKLLASVLGDTYRNYKKQVRF